MHLSCLTPDLFISYGKIILMRRYIFLSKQIIRTGLRLSSGNPWGLLVLSFHENYLWEKWKKYMKCVQILNSNFSSTELYVWRIHDDVSSLIISLTETQIKVHVRIHVDGNIKSSRKMPQQRNCMIQLVDQKIMKNLLVNSTSKNVRENENSFRLMKMNMEHISWIRDICLLSYMQELADAGVISFKVEGRSKTVNYLAWVGRAYRVALDAVESGERIWYYGTLERSICHLESRIYSRISRMKSMRKRNIFRKCRSSWRRTSRNRKMIWQRKQMARIEVKNRIDIGDTLILLSPSQRIDFTLGSIVADPILLNDVKSTTASFTTVPTNGESRESGHGWHIDLWINMPRNPSRICNREKRNQEIKNPLQFIFWRGFFYSAWALFETVSIIFCTFGFEASPSITIIPLLFRVIAAPSGGIAGMVLK